MKTKWLAMGMALIIAPPLFAQTNTVATDPVGYITVPIAGTDSGYNPAYTFLGLSMVREAAYQGALTAVGIASLTDTNASWTDGQFNGTNGTFTVEVGSTNTGGYRSTITNTLASTDTLQIMDDLSQVASAGQSYRIFKDWTLASVFGISNSSGLAGGSVVTADQLQIWNGSSYDSYYYQTSGLGGIGWRKVGAPTADAKNTPLFTEQGILVRRLSAANTNLVLVGAVKTTPTVIPVDSQFNFVANPYPVEMTLASSQLYTGNPTNGVNGGTVITADQVMVWNGSSFLTYYYQTSGLGGVGWRKAGAPSVNASTNQILGGICFIVKRQISLPFFWTAPTHPVVQ
ncbi:MAG TPA: TIGR02597 family protein [Verrucomicrobiae bacterium]|nr:TIGR02597 family protein [Verrucomicrobiae bacterium]